MDRTTFVFPVLSKNPIPTGSRDPRSHGGSQAKTRAFCAEILASDCGFDSEKRVGLRLIHKTYELMRLEPGQADHVPGDGHVAHSKSCAACGGED